MNEIDYTKLDKSFQRLVEQYKYFADLDEKNTPQNIYEGMRESVIQRFETCFDSLYKALKRYLESEGAAFEILNPSPNKIFRESYNNGIIDNLEPWVNKKNGYTQTRVDTSHDYSIDKAMQAISIIKQFIEDVEIILKQLTAEK